MYTYYMSYIWPGDLNNCTNWLLYPMRKVYTATLIPPWTLLHAAFPSFGLILMWYMIWVGPLYYEERLGYWDKALYVCRYPKYIIRAIPIIDISLARYIIVTDRTRMGSKFSMKPGVSTWWVRASLLGIRAYVPKLLSLPGLISSVLYVSRALWPLISDTT